MDLRIENVKKQFSSERDFILDIPELEIHKGEFFGLIGESGCGKTTLLKLIAGLLIPDEGSIYLGGEEITGIAAENRGMAMVFQQDRLFPYMNILDNVAFGLKMKGLTKNDRYARSSEFLSAVGLGGFERRYPLELSGGQRQRIAIARALVTNPPLVLMDEPFSALDPNLRREMRDLVLQLHREYGMTTLFVTHDREEGFYLFKRMAVIKKGKITETGIPRVLYESPGNLHTARFLGIENIIAGSLFENRFTSRGSCLTVSTFSERKKDGFLIIRPEVIGLSKYSDVEDENELKGHITGIDYSSGILNLRVETSPDSSFMLTCTALDRELRIGDKVKLFFPAGKLIFLPTEGS